MKNRRHILALPFLAILLTLSLSGCCNCANSQAISDLQRRVGELETQLETVQNEPANPDQESGVKDPPPQRP